MKRLSWRNGLLIGSLIFLIFTAIPLVDIVYSALLDEPDPNVAAKLLVGIFTAMISIALFLGSHRTSPEPIQRFAEYDFTSEGYVQDRENLLEKVENMWIRGVYQKSLFNFAKIELGFEQRTDMVERPWEAVLHRSGEPSKTLDPGIKMIEVFERIGKEVLILGGPGSGKTTTLLELAQDLITRAKGTKSVAIPVVFNLSSWATEKKTIEEWLVDELGHYYHVGRRTGEAWIHAGKVLPLLDGLDEIIEERHECVEAINIFCKEHGPPGIVVCSRTEEYLDLKEKLEINGAIEIQPLDTTQIDNYLKAGGTELDGLRSALQENADLQELAKTPLMLNVMGLAYQGMASEEITLSGDEGNILYNRIFPSYVDRMFKRFARTGGDKYSKEKTVHYLSFLANLMKEHNQKMFYLEDLQPSWLSSNRDLQRYLITERLVFPLSCGLICGLVSGLAFGLAVGLAFGLAVGLLSWLIFREAGDNLEMIESITWTWARSKSELAFMLAIVPAFVLIGGLIGGLIFGLVGGLDFGLVGGLDYGLDVGLDFGLAVGLACYLVFGIVGEETIEKRIKPEEGIRQSFKNFLFFGFAGVLISGLVTGQAVGLVGVLIGLPYGGLVVIQHYIIRYILKRTGKIPAINYVDFLDFATERIFLHQVGGGYIFIHGMLRDYFASLDTDIKD